MGGRTLRNLGGRTRTQTGKGGYDIIKQFVRDHTNEIDLLTSDRDSYHSIPRHSFPIFLPLQRLWTRLEKSICSYEYNDSHNSIRLFLDIFLSFL